MNGFQKEKDDLPPLPVPGPLLLSAATSTESATTSSSSSPSILSRPKHSRNGSQSRGTRSPDKESRSKGSIRELTLLRNIEEKKDLQRTVLSLTDQLRKERVRADDAENRLLEATTAIKQLSDAKFQAIQDAGNANEELKLYKIQLEKAQQEIFRAQDVLTIIDRRRYDAEKEAAEYRGTIRKLKEARLIEQAREEGRREGLREGFQTGREWGYGENGNFVIGTTPSRTQDGLDTEYNDDEEPDVESSVVTSSAETESDDYVSAADRRRAATPGPPSASRLPSATPAASSAVPPPPPPPTSAPPPSSKVGPVYPMAYHNNNDVSVHHARVDIPPDNFIPSTTQLDQTIRMPPPHEFRTPMSPSPRASPPLTSSRDEPIMVPPPGTYTAPQTPTTARSVTSRKSRKRRSGRGSSPDSSSTTFSQLDIIQDHSALRRATDWHHSPMSLIPEVPTPQSSPNIAEELMRRPSISSVIASTPPKRAPTESSTPRSVPPRAPFVPPRISTSTGPYQRPMSTDSSDLVPTVIVDPGPDGDGQFGTTPESSSVEITVHPPSRPSSRTPSMMSIENPMALSPSSANNVQPLPSLPSSFGAPAPTSTFGGGQAIQVNQLPFGFIPTGGPAFGAPSGSGSFSTTTPFIPPSMGSNTIPGQFNTFAPVDLDHNSTRPVIPDPKLFDNTPISESEDENKSTSSGLGSDANTLTTPPPKGKGRSLRSVATSSAAGTSRTKSQRDRVIMPPLASSPAQSTVVLPSDSISEAGNTTASKKSKGKKGKKGR